MEMISSSITLPDFLKALAHELRWNILLFLAHSDHTVAEIVRFLNQPQNVVSYHLRKLREQHVVMERRSSADSRDIYYSLDLERFRLLYQATGARIHPCIYTATGFPEPTHWHLPSPPLRVLFLCTRNSARSQMAEGILRQLSQQAIEVSSAGSQPTSLHPLALRAATALGIDLGQQRSKHVDELKDQSFAYIITVCDRMREGCPSFPGQPDLIHWSLADPTEEEGSFEQQYQAFEHTAHALLGKIRALLTRIEQDQQTPLFPSLYPQPL